MRKGLFRARGGLLAAVLALPSALSLAGCSLILDFSEIDEADAGLDAFDSCQAFETGNDPASAVAVVNGGQLAAICVSDPADHDFYAFTASGAEDITIRLEMTDGTGPRNLDLRLYPDGDSTALDEAATTADLEEIVHTEAMGGQLPAGDYVIEVFGAADGNANEYTLTVVRS